jgi:hypothetical protein
LVSDNRGGVVREDPVQRRQIACPVDHPWSIWRQDASWCLIRSEQLLDGFLDLFGPALAIN